MKMYCGFRLLLAACRKRDVGDDEIEKGSEAKSTHVAK